MTSPCDDEVRANAVDGPERVGTVVSRSDPAPIPAGFGIVPAAGTMVRTGSREVVGGDPPGVLHLTSAEAEALEELWDGEVETVEQGLVARRLIEAGCAHPRPPAPSMRFRTAVVVPVFGRVGDLDRLLQVLGDPGNAGTVDEVIVVDDVSPDPVAVAETAARHGATLVVRSENGGPAASRNSGFAACAGKVDFVAFVDTDCVPEPGWLPPLLAHFGDPEVGAVAPRILPVATGDADPLLAAYSLSRFPMDMGETEALVRAGTRIGVLPTCTMVVRCSALEGAPFDAGLRCGEDVDAVWRLVDAGWSVRYAPDVRVSHSEPVSWRTYMARRFHYGRASGPLAVRHPDRISAVMLRPGPAAAALALPVLSPTAAGVVLGSSALGLPDRLRREGVPESAVSALTAEPVGTAMIGMGRALIRLGFPFLPLVLVKRAGRGRRLAVLGALAIAPALRDWLSLRPPVDPVRWTLVGLADDVIHGAGMWSGAIRERTVTPLLPRLSGQRSGDGVLARSKRSRK